MKTPLESVLPMSYRPARYSRRITQCLSNQKCNHGEILNEWHLHGRHSPLEKTVHFYSRQLGCTPF
jgi:hypothetical protein